MVFRSALEMDSPLMTAAFLPQIESRDRIQKLRPPCQRTNPAMNRTRAEKAIVNAQRLFFLEAAEIA